MYIQKALKEYPKKELLNYYDEETVEIDQKLYKVFKHKAIPIWVNRNYKEEARRNSKDMNEALELIQKKCQKEKINTAAEFDEKIAIHYTLNDMICKYFNIIDENSSISFEEGQNQKEDFLLQILKLINMDEGDIKFYLDRIMEDYFEDDYFLENAKKLIYKLKEQLPTMKQYLNIWLSKVYQAEDYEIEKILEPINECINEFGTNEEIEIRKIEIYYDCAWEDYYEEENSEIDVYTELWQHVKEFIECYKIKTENEYDEKMEDEYCLSNILYKIDDFYENNREYIKQREKFLNEASKLLELNEDSQAIIIRGMVENYCDMDRKKEAIDLIDKFIVEFPNNTNAIITKANIFYDRQHMQCEKAVEILEQALNSNSEYDKHALFSEIALLCGACREEEKANKYQELAMKYAEELPF